MLKLFYWFVKRTDILKVLRGITKDMMTKENLETFIKRMLSMYTDIIIKKDINNKIWNDNYLIKCII
jgi:hypothetical protein